MKLTFTLKRVLLLIYAMSYYIAGLQARTDVLFTADGDISSSLINQLYQDSKGMIWIATENGLNRYDGAKISVYKNRPDEKNSLVNNYVRTIFEDSKGHLIIGTYKGVQLYDPETDSFSLPSVNSDGTPYIQTALSFYERKNGEIIICGGEIKLLKFKNGQPIVEKPSNSFPYNKLDAILGNNRSVDKILEDHTGNIWIINGENGMYRLSHSNEVRHYFAKEKGIPITDICQDSDGNIYAASMRSGLLRYYKASDSFLPVNNGFMGNLPVKDIFPGADGKVYIATDGKGIKVYDSRKDILTDLSLVNNRIDFRNAKVHSIIKDENDIFWLALYQKGVLFVPSMFNGFHYIGPKSFYNNNIGTSCVSAICIGKNGSIYVGTDNDGVYKLSKDAQPVLHYSAPAIALALFEDSDGNVWVGSYTNGMGRLSENGNFIPFKSLVAPDGSMIQRVYAFAEDREKRLWIATMGYGIFCYDLKTAKMVNTEKLNSKINDWVTCLAIGKDDSLYLGTYDGAYRINLRNLNENPERILSRTIVNAICIGNDKTVWLGTSEGLVSYRSSKEIKSYTTANGLPCNNIYAIQTDGKGNLWISSNAGLSNFILSKKLFINYNVNDGLQGNEFNKNASCKSKDGMMWFGGMNGITYFNPDAVRPSEKDVKIRVTDFIVNGRPVRKGTLSGGKEIIDTTVYEADRFTLSHYDNSFTIEFAPENFGTSNVTYYSYCMNDENWIILPKDISRVSFSNLSPGIYKFKVKATDSTSESSIREIVIRILPPWWLTWWAKLIYAILIIGVIIVAYQQIKHRNKTRQEMLKHIHAEEINEAKLQFFINISHEIRTPMSLIISPLKKLIERDDDPSRNKTYRTILRNSERLVSLVNQLMDIRKIDKGQMSLRFKETDITTVIDDICDTFRQYASEKNIRLTFHDETEHRMRLWVDPANFDKIVLNILSNAVKFTPENGTVDITLRETRNEDEGKPYAEIIIADSGIGICDAEKSHIFERFYQIRNNVNNSHVGTGVGLHLTHSLVKMHHGSIHVEDNPDNAPGCRFIIRIPLGREHLTDNEIIPDNETPEPVPANIIPPSEEKADADSKKRYKKTKYRILIAEDDDEIRKYVSEELSDTFHVIECTNGKEALDQIFSQKPDLVISDVMMPKMDGFTLCHKIKQNINLNHTPVILLTAKTMDEDNIEGLETGADAYITKPFNIDILRKTVENLIRNRERLRNTFGNKQIKEEGIADITAKSPDDKLLDRIMKVVSQHLGDSELSVDTICTEAGISRAHLHRKLRELTNQSTRQFVKNVRLTHAANMLSKKRYPIAEVAELVGFSDPNNFSTAFKELYGMSPTAYMNQQLQQQENHTGYQPE